MNTHRSSTTRKQVQINQSRLLNLSGVNDCIFLDSVSKARNHDEVLLQAIMLACRKRGSSLTSLLPDYVKKDIISRKDLSAIMKLLLTFECSDAVEIFPQLKNKDGTYYFTVRQAYRIIETSRVHVWPRQQYFFFEWYDSKEKPFPVDILKKWVRDSLDSFNPDRDKWTAKLIITLYQRGDTEILTLKNVLTYFKEHARLAPSSHGNHRMLSLLGFASKERGWDLLPHCKDIAEAMFHLLIDEIKSHHWASDEEHAPSMFGIIMEILADFENQEVTNKIMSELEGMVSNFKRNVFDSFTLSKKIYTNQLTK